MTKLATPQIYAINRQAGFNSAQAIIATAIAFAESAGDPGVIGDKNIPGPGAKSVGLFQINYLPSRDAKVPWRDPQANLDPLSNAKNAYIISKNGANFSPWTTYKTGAYRKYLPQARAAAGIEDIKNPSLVDTWKTGATDVKKNVSSAIAKANPLGGISKIVIEGVVILAGVGLVVLGLARASGGDKVATKTITKGAL